MTRSQSTLVFTNNRTMWWCWQRRWWLCKMEWRCSVRGTRSIRLLMNRLVSSSLVNRLLMILVMMSTELFVHFPLTCIYIEETSEFLENLDRTLLRYYAYTDVFSRFRYLIRSGCFWRRGEAVAPVVSPCILRTLSKNTA